MDYISNPEDVTGRHDMFSPEWVERMEGGYSRDVADVFKGAGEKRFYGGKAAVWDCYSNTLANIVQLPGFGPNHWDWNVGGAINNDGSRIIITQSNQRI